MTTVANASIFSSGFVNATATGAQTLYRRTAYNKLNAEMEDAVALGTLKTDQTQLDATAQLTKANGSHFYKFTLDGDSIKLDLNNSLGTAAVRVQLYDANGKVLADSAGTDEQKAAYANLSSAKGLSAKAGDYYVKASFAPTALRSTPQTYILSLYSGTRFQTSYETTAVSQTSLKQKVQVDNTLTFSTADAQQFGTKAVHKTKATAEDAINIGWLFQNKSALSVTSQLSNVSYDQYYSLTLQKGENLKMAFNNKTATAELRVKVMDSTGLYVVADSMGNEKQKEAYKNLISSEGMTAKPGSYVFSISYAKASDRNKNQTYNFKIFSGDYYSKVYETTAVSETMGTALLSGSLTGTGYSARAVSSAYLDMLSGGDSATSVLDALKKKYV